MIDEKIRIACHRIEELWHETDGKCYVSFSGGKDSTVLLALIKMCQDIYTVGDIPAVFSNTGIEMGVTVDFVKWVKDNWYPNVVTIRPEHPFPWVLEHEGKPLKSKLKAKELHQWHYGKRSDKLLLLLLLRGQYGSDHFASKHLIADKDMHMVSDDFPIKMSDKCCLWMKKKPFEKYAKDNGMAGCYQGIRMTEGGAREQNYLMRVKNGGKPCTWLKHGVIQKAPIIDWADEDIEEFIEKYKVPLSKAYTEFNFKRTGCCACPFALDVDHNLEYLFNHEPNRYKAMMFWLKDVYIAQNVKLPFDPIYEREREEKWATEYEPMRQEMLRKYRPNSRLIKNSTDTKLFY